MSTTTSTTPSAKPEFVDLQQYNKLIQLLGAGFIKAHSDTISGLDIESIINLPTRGNQSFEVGDTFNFDPNVNPALTSSIHNINEVIKFINENVQNSIGLDKNKPVYNLLVRYNGVIIIKDACQIDSNTKSFEFLVRPEDLPIEDIVLQSVLKLYLDELYAGDYTNYEIIKAYLENAWGVEDEDNTSWIINLLVNFKLLLDWELNIIEVSNTTTVNIPLFTQFKN